jgi:preprotein translocase subunit SecE
MAASGLVAVVSTRMIRVGGNGGTRLRGFLVAKVSPGEFIRQVRTETAKVVWPTRRETVTTAILVAVMTMLLALFFFGVDSLFGAVVKFLINLAAGN